MNKIRICILLFFGLFYFSEGKSCPEKARPHKSRCDTYYKCQDLPPKAHVWIPIKCEEGLIYESNLQLCVLPEDDWECNLGDIEYQKEAHNANMRIVATENAADDIEPKDAEIEIVSSEKQDGVHFTDNADSIQLVMDANLSSEEDEGEHNYESSGDGGEIMELDGFLQAENKETHGHHINEVGDKQKDTQMKKDKLEKEAEDIMRMPTRTSNIDPKLTAHLQRLSQLIDGLKQTYQSQDVKETEMRPDQLNAFLAHFDIKNKFNTLITKDDGGGGDSYKQTHISSTTPVPPKVVTITGAPKVNRSDTNIKPETKLMLTSGYSKRYGNNGYSNSQIVVNHPEGSVLFSLPPPYGGQEQHMMERPNEYYAQNSPKISEETLKTVLELSKQMIANQNVPKVIQNPAYYQQPTILQPLYLPAPSYSSAHGGGPFSNYYHQNNQNNNPDYDDRDNRYSNYRPNVHRHEHKKQRPSSGGGSSYTKPGTTIIHNNVIPVHVTSTNSGEKEVVDSYGQSLGLYPPLNERYQNNNNFMASVTTVRPSISSTTPASQYSGQYPSPYSTEISVTTVRPSYDYRPAPSTVAEYYTPSPHLSENNVNSLYQPSDRYPTIQYNNLPRPIDTNRPQYQQVERPSQQSQQQQQQYYAPTNINSLFPSRIDPTKVKIRPNSQKIESMEVGSEESNYDDSSSGLYNSNNNNNNDDEYMNPTQYVDPTAVLTIGNTQQKHPYMPRPSQSLSSSITFSNSNTPKFPPPHYGSSSSAFSASPEGTQLVNFGGNFIRYDVFQNSVLPLLGHSQTASDNLNANIEVITCATGVRQPNNTDCTRYYVCSKKDGKVLSYSCPPYTAFNGQTRICDAHTYSICTPSALVNSYTVNENKRIQLEAFQAMQDTKRRREQAMKTQNIANLLQQYGNSAAAQSQTSSVESGNSQEKDMLNSYMQQAAALAANTMSATSNVSKPAKKRKYYCKEGDKIPDQTSINSYFVCYKNAQGMMKGHKMTCTKGLLFCPKTTMCTLPAKCS